MIDTYILDRFEERLEKELTNLCIRYKMLPCCDVLPASDDIDEMWRRLAPEYMVDAVEQIRDYPTVSVAWAAYIGMAVAMGWDADWETMSKAEYRMFYGEQGFDDMDEHIVRDILGLPLTGDEALQIEAMTRRCGETAVTLIRREQIDPQTPMAFHIFARACKAMYRIGAAIQLTRLGYKMQPLN